MQIKNVFIVAAEDSSAIYASRFIAEWQKLPDGKMTYFWGIGSQAMVSQGFNALYSPNEMAVVGLTEVVRHYSRLRKILFDVKAQIEKERPDFLLLMDYAEFNLRLAQECRRLGIKIVYWIPPQVWAWRKGRVKKIKKYVDVVICVFPFEQEFYEAHGVRSQYFGHPLIDFIKSDYFDEARRIQRRLRAGVNQDSIVIGLMPGSRRSEIEQHFSIMLRAADLLYQRDKRLVFLVPIAPSIDSDFIRSYLVDSNVPLIIQKRQPEDVIDLMDFVVVASGTATLLAALLEKPMLIVYRMSPLTSWLLSRIVRGVQFFGLPNLVLKKRAVPELFQNEVTPKNIERLVLKWLESPELRAETKHELADLRRKLGASDSVVVQVVKYLFHRGENLG